MRSGISCSTNRTSSRATSSPQQSLNRTFCITIFPSVHNRHLRGGSMKYGPIVMAIMLFCSFCSTLQSQWVQTNGPYGGEGLGFAGTPNGTGGTNLFLAAGYGGVYLSTNYGSSWTPVNNGLQGRYVSCVGSIGSNVLAGTDVDGVYRSTDNGTSWTRVVNGIDEHETFTSFLADGANLLAGSYGDGIFLSIDSGASWRVTTDPSFHNSISSFAASPNGTGGMNIFAGVIFGGVLRSTDSGGSWTAVTAGLTNGDITSLASSPAGGRSSPNVFAGTYGGGVFRTTNNGTNWQVASVGLADSTVEALAASGSSVFAGTYFSGVFRSTDNGTSWIQTTTKLGNVRIRALAVVGRTSLQERISTASFSRPVTARIGARSIPVLRAQISIVSQRALLVSMQEGSTVSVPFSLPTAVRLGQTRMMD